MANLPALYAEAWTAPRQSMRRILSLNLSERDRVMLVGVTGILFAIPLTLFMQTMEMPEGPDGVPLEVPSGFLIATLIVGATLVGYYFTAALLKFIGGLFGGSGSFEQCRTAAAWFQFVIGLANLAMMALSIILPSALSVIVQTIFLIASIYIASAYITEAHGFRSPALVAAGYVGIFLLMFLLLSSFMPAGMVPAPQ